MISGVSGIKAQIVTQTQFFKELTAEINDLWIFLYVLGYDISQLQKSKREYLSIGGKWRCQVLG